MATDELHATAKALVSAGKGILAADESDGTIKKRFDTIGVESTEEHRRSYREMLFTTQGVEDYISGVILFDETIRQSNADSTPFAQLLASKGIIPGIKVDKGAKALALTDRETITEGLDGLRAPGGVPRPGRAVCEVARDVLNQRSAAKRVLHLDQSALAGPLRRALPRGAAGLDRRAGGAPRRHNTIERSHDVTALVLDAVYRELFDQRVDVFGTLLKPNVGLSGHDASNRAGQDEVPEVTLKCLYKHVPAAVPGIVFLSGGPTSRP
jgi:fructose-bisphosphate aldolase class I